MLCHAMPCYAMLCYAMLCYALLCFAMLCCAVLCCAVLNCAMLCYAMLCYAVLCCAMLCYATLRYAVLSMRRHATLRCLCYAMLAMRAMQVMLCYALPCCALLSYSTSLRFGSCDTLRYAMLRWLHYAGALLRYAVLRYAHAALCRATRRDKCYACDAMPCCATLRYTSLCGAAQCYGTPPPTRLAQVVNLYTLAAFRFVL